MLEESVGEVIVPVLDGVDPPPPPPEVVLVLLTASLEVIPSE